MIDRTPRPCLHPRANHQHGTHLAYAKDGCHCDPCSEAYRRHAKLTAHRTRTGTHSYVDAGRAREQVRVLLRVLTVGQIESRSGVHRTCIRRLVGDFPGQPMSKRITRTTEAALLSVPTDFVGIDEHCLVDATGSARRLRALAALGYGHRSLAESIGASTATVWKLQNAKSHPAITAATRSRIMDLYDRLSMTLPPEGRGTSMTRRNAERKGWAPPLAWDDDKIDDPKARTEPMYATRGPADVPDDPDEAAVIRLMAGDLSASISIDVREEAVRRLHAQGMSDGQIGVITGLADRTVLRIRQRLGLESTYPKVSA